MTLLARILGRTSQMAADWLEPDQLAALLEGPEPPVVIDVRGPDEFTGPLGHIETAVNIPLDQIAGRASALALEGKPLVMVCHTDRRSAAAAQQLRSAGAAAVSVLRGGMVAWRSRGV